LTKYTRTLTPDRFGIKSMSWPN